MLHAGCTRDFTKQVCPKVQVATIGQIQPNYTMLLFMEKRCNKEYKISLSVPCQILGECQDVAENVALALSIITLFVLCEPRDQVTIHSIMDGGYSSSKYRDIMGW